MSRAKRSGGSRSRSKPKTTSRRMFAEGDVVLTTRKLIGVIRCIIESSSVDGSSVSYTVGLELTEGSGNTNGYHNGTQYFECKPKYAKFIKLSEVERRIPPEELLNKIVILNNRSLRASAAQEKERRELQRTQSELEDSLKKWERVRKKFHASEEANKRLGHEIDRLTDMLRLTQEELFEFNKRYDESVSEINQLRFSLSNANNEVRRLKNRLAHVEASVDESHRQLIAAKAAHAAVMAHESKRDETMLKNRFQHRTHPSSGTVGVASAAAIGLPSAPATSVAVGTLDKLGIRGMVIKGARSADTHLHHRLPSYDTDLPRMKTRTSDASFGDVPPLPDLPETVFGDIEKDDEKSGNPKLKEETRQRTVSDTTYGVSELYDDFTSPEGGPTLPSSSPIRTSLRRRMTTESNDSSMSWREIMSRSAAAAARKGQRMSFKRAMTKSAALAAKKAAARMFIKQHKAIFERSAKEAAEQARDLEVRRGHHNTLNELKKRHSFLGEGDAIAPSALLQVAMQMESAAESDRRHLRPMDAAAGATTPLMRRTIKTNEDGLDLDDIMEEKDTMSDAEWKFKGDALPAGMRQSQMDLILQRKKTDSTLLLAPPLPEDEGHVSEAEEFSSDSSSGSSSANNERSFDGDSSEVTSDEDDEKNGQGNGDFDVDRVVTKLLEESAAAMHQSGDPSQTQHERGHTFDYLKPKDRLNDPGSRRSSFLDSYSHPYKDPSVTKDRIEKRGRLISDALHFALMKDKAAKSRRQSRQQSRSSQRMLLDERGDATRRSRSRDGGSSSRVSPMRKPLLKERQSGGSSKSADLVAATHELVERSQSPDEFLLDRERRAAKFRTARTPIEKESFKPVSRRAVDRGSLGDRKGFEFVGFPGLDSKQLSKLKEYVPSSKGGGKSKSRGSFSQPASPTHANLFMASWQRAAEKLGAEDSGGKTVGHSRKITASSAAVSRRIDSALAEAMRASEERRKKKKKKMSVNSDSVRYAGKFQSIREGSAESSGSRGRHWKSKTTFVRGDMVTHSARVPDDPAASSRFKFDHRKGGSPLVPGVSPGGSIATLGSGSSSVGPDLPGSKSGEKRTKLPAERKKLPRTSSNQSHTRFATSKIEFNSRALKRAKDKRKLLESTQAVLMRGDKQAKSMHHVLHSKSLAVAHLTDDAASMSSFGSASSQAKSVGHTPGSKYNPSPMSRHKRHATHQPSSRAGTDPQRMDSGFFSAALSVGRRELQQSPASFAMGGHDTTDELSDVEFQEPPLSRRTSTMSKTEEKLEEVKGEFDHIRMHKEIQANRRASAETATEWVRQQKKKKMRESMRYGLAPLSSFSPFSMGVTPPSTKLLASRPSVDGTVIVTELEIDDDETSPMSKRKSMSLPVTPFDSKLDEYDLGLSQRDIFVGLEEGDEDVGFPDTTPATMDTAGALEEKQMHPSLSAKARSSMSRMISRDSTVIDDMEDEDLDSEDDEDDSFNQVYGSMSRAEASSLVKRNAEELLIERRRKMSGTSSAFDSGFPSVPEKVPMKAGSRRASDLSSVLTAEQQSGEDRQIELFEDFGEEAVGQRTSIRDGLLSGDMKIIVDVDLSSESDHQHGDSPLVGASSAAMGVSDVLNRRVNQDGVLTDDFDDSSSVEIIDEVDTPRLGDELNSDGHDPEFSRAGSASSMLSFGREGEDEDRGLDSAEEAASPAVMIKHIHTIEPHITKHAVINERHGDVPLTPEPIDDPVIEVKKRKLSAKRRRRRMHQ